MPIVLLDVDETCAISNQQYGEHDGGYRYHEPLFQALLASGLKEVYLFTAYTLTGISKTLEEESVGAPSRLKLLSHLQQRGITVQGVITLLDPIYGQGIGAYYEQQIKPYEAAVLKGENLYTDGIRNAYQEACARELKLRERSMSTDKGHMFAYVRPLFEEKLKADHPNCLPAFMVVDDRAACLEAVRSVYPASAGLLLTIKVDPYATSSHYIQEIQPFLAQAHQREHTAHFKAQFIQEPKTGVNLLQEALEVLTQPIPGEEPCVTMYGLQTPRYLSLAAARRLLSQDVQGHDCKTNVQGNNVVVRVGDVFFKRNPDYALTEQAVYQLSELLGGEVIAPSRLLFLQMPEGLIPLQASLAVEGIGLDDLLKIPGGMLLLQTLLKEQLLQELPSLLDNSYLNDWLSQHPGYSLASPWEEQCTVLLDELLKLPSGQRPQELRQGERWKLEKELREGSALKGKALLPVLALLERYPDLKDECLSDLVHLPSSFCLLNQLYGGLPPSEILSQALHIASQIDQVSFSRHVILAILTQPQDHKGDNFKVRIKRDVRGKLLPFEVVGIDNDAAMEGAVQVFKNGEHEIRAKTIFYALEALLSAPVHSSVREHLLNCQPELLVMEWLYRLAECQRDYQERLLPHHFPLLQALHLDQQLPLGFAERLIQQLYTLQSELTQNSTHAALLERIEPLTARYYQALRRQIPDPQELMVKLYQRRNLLSVERVLGTNLPVEKGTLFQKNIEYQSYLQPIPKLSTKTELLQNDLSLTALLRLLSRAKSQRLQTVTLPGLRLSGSVFTEVYKHEPVGFIRLLHENATDAVLALPTGAVRLSEINLHSVMPLPNAQLLLHGLLAYGVSVQQTRAVDGYTPLHLAGRFNDSNFIPLLVQAGVNLEALDVQGNTALDKATEYQHWEAAQALLIYGAGKQLKMSNGLALMRSPVGAIWLQSLVALNVELAWELALQNLTQVEPTPEKVCIEGIEGIRYLRSAIYQQIFYQKSEFPRENAYGRHAVTAIRCEAAPGVMVGLHLKENPELPGREMMVHYLAKHLFGLITPPVSLWRFSKSANRLWQKSEVAYPVLASRSVIGENLRDVLDSHPERLAQLDTQSVSEAIVLAMLINPEDGRADNYLLEPFQQNDKTWYRLISIDNDHAFVPPVALKSNGEEQEGPKSLQVKTILYCLDQMGQPLHPSTQERLLALKPYDLLQAWLLGLKEEQRKIERMFGTELMVLQSKNIHLEIAFKPSIMLDIYQKFCRLQRALRKNPQITGLSLLRKVMPNLAVRYWEAFSQGDTPEARFSWLTDGCFEKKMVQGKAYAMSTTNAVRIVEMTRSWEETHNEHSEERNSSLEDMLQQLTRIQEQGNNLEAVRDALQAGNTKPFQQLLNQDYQSWIVNGHGALEGINFEAMRKEEGSIDLKRQRLVLNAISKIPFARLRLHHCASLTDSELIKILKVSKGLSALEIRGCPKITPNILQELPKLCPALEKLSLSNLNWLGRVRVKQAFKALRALILDNIAFEECLLKAERLESLTIRKCNKLSEEALSSLLDNHHAFKDIIINECELLSELNASGYLCQIKLVKSALLFLAKLHHDDSSVRAEAVAALLTLDKESIKTQQRLPIKIVMIGACCAGKSTLLRALCSGEFCTVSSPTIGAEFGSLKFLVNNINIFLEFWDTAGQARYQPLYPMYYRNASLIMNFLDTTKSDAFTEGNGPFDATKSEFSGSAMIIGTKTDLVDKRQWNYEEGIAFAQKNGFIDYLECGNKIDRVKEIFLTAGLLGLINFITTLSPSKSIAEVLLKYREKRWSAGNISNNIKSILEAPLKYTVKNISQSIIKSNESEVIDAKPIQVLEGSTNGLTEITTGSRSESIPRNHIHYYTLLVGAQPVLCTIIQTHLRKNCLFEAVGVSEFSRANLVKRLLEQSSNVEIRNAFAREIYNFLILGMTNQLSEALERSAFQKLCTPEFLDLSGKYTEQESSDLKINSVGLRSSLQEPIDESILDYCRHKVVFETFVREYLQEAKGYMTCGQPALNTDETVIEVINRLFGLNIQIYVQKNLDLPELTCLNYKVESHNSIILFYDGRYQFLRVNFLKPLEDLMLAQKQMPETKENGALLVQDETRPFEASHEAAPGPEILFGFRRAFQNEFLASRLQSEEASLDNLPQKNNVSIT